MCDKKQMNSKPFGESRFINSFGGKNVVNGDCLQPNKKPRLDVSVCSSSSSGNSSDKNVYPEQPVPSTSKHQTANDDLWEELDETAFDECELIATQALSQQPLHELPVQTNYIDLVKKPIQYNQVKRNTPNIEQKNPRLVGKSSNRGVPLFRASSAGTLTSPNSNSRLNSVQCINRPQHLKVDTEHKGGTNWLQSELNRYEEKCRMLTEKLQTKEGETSLLRSHLKQSKLEREKQSKEWAIRLQQMKQRTSQQTVTLQKQLDEACTSLEFKSLEVKSLEEKFKQLKTSKSSVSPVKTGNSRKSDDLSRSFHFEDNHIKETLTRSSWAFGNLSLSVNHGSLLAKCIIPEIYHPSSPENCRAKSSRVSLFDKKVVEGAEKPNRTDAVTRCSLPLMMLTKCESFSTNTARNQLKKIVEECVKSLDDQIKGMEYEGDPVQLVNRTRELMQKSHTIVPLTESYSLLNAKKWYPEERGVEVRRMLGLLASLIDVSSKVAELIIPEFLLESTVVTEKQSKNKTTSENKPNDMKNNDDDDDNDDDDKDDDANEMVIEETAEQKSNPSSLLHILRDLISLIACERRTLQYNGILAGASAFLTSLARKRLKLTEDGQEMMLNIIHDVLTSCPGSTVVLHVCEFLLAVNYYPFITKRLCVNTVQKFFEVEYNRCYLFSKSTCTVTVLCYIVQAMSEKRRFLVADVITRWFLDLVTKYDKSCVANWLTPCPNNSEDIDKDCACPWNLSKVVTTLLCEAALLYDSERNQMNPSDRVTLENLLERGIVLLNKILLLNNSFGLHLGDIEGQYELYVHTLVMLDPGIQLQTNQKNILEQILKQEEIKQPVSKGNLSDSEDMRKLFTDVCHM